MKKLILTLSLAITFYSSAFAQWTNVTGTGNWYLNSGKVGIGTATPALALEVVGNDTPLAISNSSVSGSSTSGETSIYFGDAGSGVNMLRASKRTFNTRAFEIWTEYGYGVPSKSADFYNNYVNFYTNNTNRFSIDNNGYVGIGTTVPESNLHIYESEGSKTNGVIMPTKSILKLSRGGTHNYSYNESAEFRLGHGGPSVWGSKLDLFVNGGSNQSNIPDQHVMSWLYNGDVGIGTMNPEGKSDVYGTGYFGFQDYRTQATQKVLVLRAEPMNGVYAQSRLNFYMNPGTTVNGISSLDVKSVYGSDAESSTLFKFKGNGDFYALGNVLIGKTSQDNLTYKLDIDGKARANEIVVNTTGADFVFEPEYKLPKLSEVKDYIDQNHHLPQIQSASEMQKNGMNVGELNTKLLQKVEELTLYLIEQSKQLTEQQKVNQSLQKQIDQLAKSK